MTSASVADEKKIGEFVAAAAALDRGTTIADMIVFERLATELSFAKRPEAHEPNVDWYRANTVLEPGQKNPTVLYPSNRMTVSAAPQS